MSARLTFSLTFTENAGTGKIAIEIDVRGTAEMKELGASDVYVYEV